MGAIRWRAAGSRTRRAIGSAWGGQPKAGRVNRERTGHEAVVEAIYDVLSNPEPAAARTRLPHSRPNGAEECITSLSRNRQTSGCSMSVLRKLIRRLFGRKARANGKDDASIYPMF